MNDVLDGKTKLNDYTDEQRELMWNSFKDSNRGTETFYRRDESGNINGRETISNNGTLYRQLYDEYGGKPRKSDFNEAFDDVMKNGKNSKYYDGFREFDHSGERSVFDFNRGNENLDDILELKSYLKDVARSKQTPEVEAAKDGLSGVESDKKKLMDTSNIENPVQDAIESGKKMTTQEFFKASKVSSNDLASMKKNYPNEVESVKKLIKAGVTPETFDNAVLNKDGSAKTAYKGREIPPMRAMFEMAYNYNKVTDAGSAKNQKIANLFGSEAIKENTTKKSSVADNVSKNDAFSEEVRQALADNPVEYKPATNEERLARANEILSTKSLSEVDQYLRDNYFNTAEKYRNSGDTVLAGEYAKMLDADGQYGRATEVIQEMSKIATKQGQQIQALSILANRSPEGIANMAQTAIQKGGGKVDGEVRKQILSNTQEIGKIRAKRAELTNENETLSYNILLGSGR